MFKHTVTISLGPHAHICCWRSISKHMEINSAYKTSGWTITSWMYFSAIGDNLLSAYLFLWCFFKSDYYFPNWCTDPPKIVKFETEYFVGVQQSVTLNCEAEGNPPPTYTWIPCDSEQVCDKNTLLTSQVLNDANYTCRVASARGVDSKTANVCKSHVHFSHAPSSCIFIHVPTWHFEWVLRVEPGVSLSGCKSPNSALIYFSWWITLSFL